MALRKMGDQCVNFNIMFQNLDKVLIPELQRDIEQHLEQLYRELDDETPLHVLCSKGD